jgi:RNA polymerase sigma factor (sigma-70 family)
MDRLIDHPEILQIADSSFDSSWIREEIETAAEGLNQRQRAVLTKRFWDCEHLTEIARQLGLSRGRVGQINADALRMMRKKMCKESYKGIADRVRMRDEIGS